MSYLKNIKNIVKSMPTNAKLLMIKTYEKAVKVSSEKEAFDLAMKAVIDKYKKQNNKWVIKKSVKVNTTIAKSGFFFPKYYFDAVIDDSLNQDTYRPTSTLLSQLYNEKKIDTDGDIEHYKLEDYGNNDKFNGIFKLTKSLLKENTLYGRFEINKKHKNYKDFLKLYPTGIPLGLSAEYINPIVVGKDIVSAERLGWSICSSPKNNRAVVYSAN